MEGHKNKITVLMAEINRVNEENQKLKSMFNCACYRYNYLQEHIRHMLQQGNGVDGSQLFNRDHPSEVKLWRRSINVDSSSTVSHQSVPYRGDRERSRETVEKNVKFMEDQPLPSKKRKNGMIDSSIEQTEKSPKKKIQLMTKASGQHNVAAAKRILSVQARSEASLINDGCQWRKYGEKMIKNNERPRSYYRCVTAPGCPAKKQVQTCAQDRAIVVTTYKGEHTHSLSALPTVAMTSPPTRNQLLSGQPDNQPIRSSTAITRLSNSSPSITLDLTDNRSDRSGIKLESAQLAADSFQHLISLSNDTGQASDSHNQQNNYLTITQDPVASIMADYNFTTSRAVAIPGYMVNLL